MTGGAIYGPLMLSIPCVPLSLACVLLLWPQKSVPLVIAPWAAAPALLASLVPASTSTVHLPWLLLGMDLGIDRTAQVFLFFSGLLWLSAGVFAAGYFEDRRSRTRFFTYFLFAMAGNLGLIVTQDMLSFFMFFALLSFASYGLVVHDGTPEARRAGHVYIVMVIAGELLLFTAMVLAADAAGSIAFDQVRPAVAEAGTRDLILALALSGFGIKLGVLGLHVWLPLAHPVAPTPASAVLSGAMIKAGLLGWLRLLPLGEVVLPWWGGALMAAGLGATFYGVVVGIAQRNPKTVLAYSSISQMGLVTAGVGLGLTAPSRWPEISAAVLFLALHHALAKGALFLGAGISALKFSASWRRWLVAAGLSLPALALAGAPFTSGGLAKALLKAEAGAVSSSWGDLFQSLLPWTGVATTLLMVRFLYLAWPRAATASTRLKYSLSVPWMVLVSVLILAPWYWWTGDMPGEWSEMLPGLWTLAIGAAGGVALVRLAGRNLPMLPAGDIIVPVERVLARTFRATRRAGHAVRREWLRIESIGTSGLGRLLSAAEQGRFADIGWASACMLFLLMALVFVLVATL